MPTTDFLYTDGRESVSCATLEIAADLRRRNGNYGRIYERTYDDAGVLTKTILLIPKPTPQHDN